MVSKLTVSLCITLLLNQLQNTCLLFLITWMPKTLMTDDLISYKMSFCEVPDSVTSVNLLIIIHERRPNKGDHWKQAMVNVKFLIRSTGFRIL